MISDTCQIHKSESVAAVTSSPQEFAFYIYCTCVLQVLFELVMKGREIVC